MSNGPSASVRKFIPEQYLQVVGKNLPGLLQAIDESVEKTEEQVQAIIDQLFLVTASGRFLVQLGEEQGFIMPENSGLDIRSYRVLVPIMVSDPKQVRITIDQLVQAFYGSERTKPNTTATVAGPFNLNDGDNLIVETEAGTVDISITSDQVSNVSNVTVGEIAAVLNSSQSLYLATVVKNRSTGQDFLRVTTNTPGAGAFIKIAGGTMQNVLLFDVRAETAAESGTTWNLSKSSSVTDELRFTWDAVGTNPNVYLANKGDVVTLRGFVDGVDPWSKLNGTFELVDVGYDYFVVRNEAFEETVSAVSQPDDNSVIFTKNEAIDLFDNSEFALTSETSPQTITITVPAVPPLAKRFLAGSAHLHGFVHRVLDFTRTAIQVQIEADQEKPQGENTLIISNKYHRTDLVKKQYKTSATDSNTSTPLYSVSAGEADRAVFPYTVAQTIGTDVFYANVGQEEVTVTFPHRHGLRENWGMTLDGFTGISNFLAGSLNAEQVVKRVIDENSVTFRMLDANGVPLKFLGIPFGPCSVYRHTAPQNSGADFYMDFGTAAAVTASGLQPGQTFQFNPFGGSDLNLFYSGLLRFRTMTVSEIDDEKVHFSAGLGTGPEGIIMSGVSGTRSGEFGGSAGTYFFDKASAHNQEKVMTDLFATFTGYTPSSNEKYVGSFLFDPSGAETSVTVSRFLTALSDPILKGSTARALPVDFCTCETIDEHFPDSGEIVIDYGTDKAEGPIRYSAFIENSNGTQIIIDPAYRFQYSHDSGANVQAIHSRAAYVPATEGEDFPVYLTGTTAARNTLFELVELLVASGIFVEANVLLPDLRYEDESIQSFV